jgi:hypothetical protein
MPAINLILPAFFLSFFLAVLLLTKKNGTVSDRVLSGYFILLAYLEMLNRNNGYRWPWLIHASTPFVFIKRKIRPIYRKVRRPFSLIQVVLQHQIRVNLDCGCC